MDGNSGLLRPSTALYGLRRPFNTFENLILIHKRKRVFIIRQILIAFECECNGPNAIQ